MAYTADEKALIWLSACTDLGTREKAALLRAAPSPQILFEEFEKFYAQVILKGQNGVYKEGGLAARERQVDDLLSEMSRKGYFAVTCLDADYPEPLKAADPPIALFGAGNRALLKEEKFCIVGSRVAPSWAEKLGTRISETLSNRFAIVTGLAEGGDLAAIKGALPSGKLICVLPCGLDECYPAAHMSVKEEIKRKGLLLSELPFKERVHKGSFHARNLILAGLSKGVLVLSAGEKSGALITANFATDYGRDVFAFPYSLGFAHGTGCNALIKKGAFLCTEANDILDCYGIVLQEKKRIALLPQEELILSALKESERLHSAAIAEKTNLQIYEVAAFLSALELKGLVVKDGGNFFKYID